MTGPKGKSEICFLKIHNVPRVEKVRQHQSGKVISTNALLTYGSRIGVPGCIFVKRDITIQRLTAAMDANPFIMCLKTSN